MMSALLASLSLATAPFVAYRSFNPEPEMTAEFARMGIETRCFFAANTLNSLGNPYCRYPEIWKGIGKYDWSAFEAQAEDLLKASPNASFLILIDLNMPGWFARKCGYDSFAEIARAASDPEWRRITAEWMEAMLTYAERKYGERIVGYILSGGGTSEWYEYDRGVSSAVKNAAWREWCRVRGLGHGPEQPVDFRLKNPSFDGLVYDPVKEPDCIDWWRFNNAVVADALLGFAAQARRLVACPKQLGAFFGYFYVSDQKITSFGHLDYERVCASPDLDFILAPGNYSDRVLGGCGGTQLVPGTVALNGKRFLHEIDFGPNQYGWKTSADRIAGNIREAAFALVNHADSWWFDMWGGFYDDPLLRERIARLKRIHDRLGADESPSAAEVLLVADPQSMAFICDKAPKGSMFGQNFRNNLGHVGVPFDVYSFNDLARIDLGRYKAVFLPAALLIDEVREGVLREKVCRDGRTVAWMYAPGLTDGKTLDETRVKRFAGVAFGTPGVSSTAMEGWRAVYAPDLKTWTTEALARVCRAAGVHFYLGEPAIVYANRRVLSVHVTTGGEKTIRLPRRVRKAVDLISGTTVAENADTLTCVFETPDTRLFELED